jgi:hypothetical protein
VEEMGDAKEEDMTMRHFGLGYGLQVPVSPAFDPLLLWLICRNVPDSLMSTRHRFFLPRSSLVRPAALTRMLARKSSPPFPGPPPGVDRGPHPSRLPLRRGLLIGRPPVLPIWTSSLRTWRAPWVHPSFPLGPPPPPVLGMAIPTSRPSRAQRGLRPIWRHAIRPTPWRPSRPTLPEAATWGLTPLARPVFLRWNKQHRRRPSQAKMIRLCLATCEPRRLSTGQTSLDLASSETTTPDTVKSWTWTRRQ